MFQKRIVASALFLCFVTLFTYAQTAIIPSVTTPQNALSRYLNNGDNTYKWEIKNSYSLEDITVYSILLTSQKWREYTWTHQLSIIVPKENKHDGALLFITGGSINKEGLPNWSDKGDGLVRSFSAIAKENSAVVAVLKQTPNQPLYGDLTEDALISYTLHNYKKDGDYSWPLLFPMVKSAKSAMDAVQDFSKQKLRHSINRFVVSGASKRGWTTWLTGAVDKRVTAIAPMVIDMLNMPVSMNYQIKVWKDYSIQIEDYVKLGLVQDLGTNGSNDLTTMIDPYAYRKALTMPKMIVMGTNDEYWPIDNIKNYYDSIPGQNLIHYVPNVGHSLGDGKEAMTTLSSFFGLTMSKSSYPVCIWKSSQTDKGVKVNIKTTADKLINVTLWRADSPDLDFRNDKWDSQKLDVEPKSEISTLELYPPSGYRAFYINLKYKDSKGGEYMESTRVFMTDDKKLL
ncbi:PhoPQ-activated protein PqaA family protein [Pedobacter sp. B4-66]|uniref:PhoPQ-activated pathogenicity-related family protein n=1 Tax=Pedobacter sp. B4-66 TaxID=2817280 RepID=UPI001BD96833|nr:PhoPQ-activated protein PqaA family protein [Pedobacter sp. B4-66]